jgi:hypothetical protein
MQYTTIYALIYYQKNENNFFRKVHYLFFIFQEKDMNPLKLAIRHIGIEQNYITEIEFLQDNEINKIPQKILMLLFLSLCPDTINIIYNYFFLLNISLGVRIWSLKISNLVRNQKIHCWYCDKHTDIEFVYTIHRNLYVRTEESEIRFNISKEISEINLNELNKYKIVYDIYHSNNLVETLKSEMDIPAIQKCLDKNSIDCEYLCYACLKITCSQLENEIR